MTPEVATHPCATCARPIDNRFPNFRICVRCSLDALDVQLRAEGYYERQAGRIARREEEEAAERLRAKGILK